ncbi:MAG: hypothetical protein EA402_00685, partial [Planctomycetota bacterium]
MSLRLNFNASAIRAQLNLQTADRLLGRSTERLSSGLRLNRSADDPSGLTIANALRYQVRGLATATDNVENGINLISTAEGALDEVNSLLNRMRGLAVNAANDAINDPARLQAIQQEINEILSSINRIADNTQFGSVKLINGGMAANTFDRVTMDSRNLRSYDYYESLSQDYRVLQDGIIQGSKITVDPPSGDLTRSQLQVTLSGAPLTETTTINNLAQNGVPLSAAVGESITITGPRGDLTININADTTIGNVLDRINGTSERTGLRADFDAQSGQFRIESLAFGSTEITVTSSADMSLGFNRGLFDADVTNPDNNSYFSAAANQTVEIGYQNRLGQQSITLIQDPTIAGGRGFRDPDSAFTLILKDRSDGSLGSTNTVADIRYTATRSNPDRVMLGPQQGMHALLDIPDMHSLVLGQNNGTNIFRNLGEISVAPPTGRFERSRVEVTFDGNPPANTLIDGIIQNGNTLNSAVGESLEIVGPLGSLTVNIGPSTTIAQIRDLVNGNRDFMALGTLGPAVPGHRGAKLAPTTSIPSPGSRAVRILSVIVG